MGDAVDDPVLLLKSCIGNRSLGWDLLPPGSERSEFVAKDKAGVEKKLVYAGYKDKPESWEMDPAKGLKTEPAPWVDKNGKPIDWYAGKQYDADIAKAKNGCSVRNDGNEIAFGGVFIDVGFVLGNAQARLCNTR